MKIIRITTDNEISVHEYPAGSYMAENTALRKLIGPCCELYEHVMPKRLYKELGGSNRVSSVPGNCVNMLVDEEGLLKKLPANIVGSWLYESDLHGWPIVGNVLITGEVETDDGICFCGMSDDQFALLYPKLKSLTEKVRKKS